MPKSYQPPGVGMAPCRSDLGAYIRERRLTLGLRQAELAERCGVSQAYVSYIETREDCVGKKALKPFARALRCRLNDLLARRGQRQNSRPIGDLERFVRTHCERLGLSPLDLAERMGWPRSRVYGLQSGHKRSITVVTAKRLASALGVPLVAVTPFVQSRNERTITNFGRLIRDRRLALGYNQTDFARLLGVSRARVSYIETMSCRPRSKTITRLSGVLRLDEAVLRAALPNKRNECK